MLSGVLCEHLYTCAKGSCEHVSGAETAEILRTLCTTRENVECIIILSSVDTVNHA